MANTDVESFGIWTRYDSGASFQFKKCSQLFIGVHNETLSVVAVCVNNPDCSFVQTLSCFKAAIEEIDGTGRVVGGLTAKDFSIASISRFTSAWKRVSLSSIAFRRELRVHNPDRSSFTIGS